jgi:RNA binding exosome subunit
MGLSRNMRILSVEISVIAHATEDPVKVSQALRNVLPNSISSDAKVTTQHLQGHHGNPIKILKTNLKKRKMIDQFFDHLLTRLDSDDLESITKNIDTHMDEDGNLYIRINKQAAYMGELQSKQEDPIRIKVKLVHELGKGKPPIELVKELMEGHEKVR